MLDLWPRFLLKYIPVKEKKYFCYSLTAICVSLVGLLYNTNFWHQSHLFSTGYSAIGSFREVVHIGRCPLCGGTRSFLSLLSGDVIKALHYNIFGTFLFAIIYGLLPFRIALALGFNSLILNKTKILDRWLENNFLYLLAIIFFVQVLLDRLGVFVWKG
ncbi:DUF2752 domain-containing protein [Proteinivorax hydrogeniformans]|uniref:DUF2752 domain-containing protein n=1 Tax=Proteinivorax hydrogeniformans TaxID=1826727 RepID=A0AAU8HU81_9FIRM